jgi:phosphoribosylglycinamide formyltransferase-1
MKIVGPTVLARYPGRIVNVHPALLPSFPGKDGPAQAIAGGVRVSGCTVHVVDAGVDTGPILAQGVVPVLPDDDADSLHARIQRVEHRLLPSVVHWIATGAIELGPPARLLRVAFPDGTLTVPELDT